MREVAKESAVPLNFFCFMIINFVPNVLNISSHHHSSESVCKTAKRPKTTLYHLNKYKLAGNCRSFRPQLNLIEAGVSCAWVFLPGYCRRGRIDHKQILGNSNLPSEWSGKLVNARLRLEDFDLTHAWPRLQTNFSLLAQKFGLIPSKRSAPSSYPLPFYIPFWQKLYPFRVLFDVKGAPFIYLKDMV